MRSTSDDTVPDAIGALFDDVILPLSQQLQVDGAPPLPLKPDPMLKSYYVERAQTAMVREDFSTPSCLNTDELAQCLSAYWQSRGRYELLAAVPSIVAAARVQREHLEANKPQNTELSPLIYVMF